MIKTIRISNEPTIQEIPPAPRSFYQNYDRSGLIYMVNDRAPPEIIGRTSQDTLITRATRAPIDGRKVEWFAKYMPLGFTNWPKMQ